MAPARSTDFASVLAIGYRAHDAFGWHTDLAGEDGWVCSLSLGATATFEYLPVVAVSAAARAQARKEKKPISVEIQSGDCVLFHGGYLPHRIAGCAADLPASFAHMAAGTGIARLNLQVRPYGASIKHGLRGLLASGFGRG